MSKEVTDCTAIGTDSAGRLFALSEELNLKVGKDWSSESLGPPDSWEGCPYNMGAKRDWLPPLGEFIWEISKNLEDRGYYAYIFRTDCGRRFGYVRIHDYNPSRDALRVFEAIIARFESSTEAMVLDQVHNGGGDMFQMYALLSMLTDRPLVLPQHSITISDDQLAVAADIVANASLGDQVPPDERASPELIRYSREVLAEHAAGRGTGKKPSSFLYLGGVSEILPANTHYTRKIVVVNSLMTFSAAEFLAAILQDNKRATIFGERTAGAGGCGKEIYIPGQERLGIKSMMLRWTEGRRSNGEYIEHRGIQPDVPHEHTMDDAWHDYLDFKRALLAALDS